MNWFYSRETGKKGSAPTQPPFEYALLKYRQKFNLSWPELLRTPFGVVKKDLEILDIEESVIKSKEAGIQTKLDVVTAQAKKLNANTKR